MNARTADTKPVTKDVPTEMAPLLLPEEPEEPEEEFLWAWVSLRR